MGTFEFDPKDWLTDPKLRRCEPATRGIWIDAIALMELDESNGVLLGRWGENTNGPGRGEWMLRLTYSPLPGEPDTRLPDPRVVFMLVVPVSDCLLSNALSHCMENLRRIRENAINHNFDPAKLAHEAETAVSELFSLPETLGDRILAAIEAQPTPEQSATLHPKPKKPKVNDRMTAELASNLETVKGWTARKWAAFLGCAKSTVIEAPTWKSLSLLRQQAKAEKRSDRRRAK